MKWIFLNEIKLGMQTSFWWVFNLNTMLTVLGDSDYCSSENCTRYPKEEQ